MPDDHLATWFFGLSFVATSATIVSGAMAERTKLTAYIIASVVISSLTFPVVSHWVWDPRGFMSLANPDAPLPLLDFAGCGVVHMTGGITALCGACAVGPRPGAFLAHVEVPVAKKDAPLRDRMRATQSLWTVLGTLMLWVAWYGFSCGSAGGITGRTVQCPALTLGLHLGAWTPLDPDFIVGGE